MRQKKRGLRWKTPPKPGPEKNRSLPNLLGPLRLLAVVGKWVLITAAAAALVYVLWRHRSHLLRRLQVTSAEEPPETLFGLDIRPESLPAGLDDIAAGLWAQGRIRAALALLYRGALAHLVHRARAPLTRGSTEGDCLRRAEAVLPGASAAYFGRLTRVWLVVAYAGQEPPPGAERLCTEWRQHFQDPLQEVRP